MHRCRANLDITAPASDTLEWDPGAITHGDLGVAMVYSAADHLDPDGGWDQLAHAHLTKAARRLQQVSGTQMGLFSGTPAVAFTLRAHSRSGGRYHRAITQFDAFLTDQLTLGTDHVDLTSGSLTPFFDVISGLSGAISYVFTTDAGTGKLGQAAIRAIDALAELALTDCPGGLWTPTERLHELERARWGHTAPSQLNCGFAHGIAGVLNVLGQASDRGWGSPLVPEATEHLAGILLAASDLNGTLDVPYRVLPETAAAADRTRSRYAWCYGNLGAALPFHNSATLRRKHPDVITRLLDTSERTEEDLQLSGPTLCHGRAGKLVLERIMLGEDTVVGNTAALLQLADPARPYLLEDDRRGSPFDSPGFLSGSGGAASALLSLQAPADTMTFTRMLTGTWIV